MDRAVSDFVDEFILARQIKVLCRYCCVWSYWSS